MKKYHNEEKLPVIKVHQKVKSKKTSTIYEKINQRFQSLKQVKSNSISDILTSVRKSMKVKIEDQKSLQKDRIKFQQRQKRKQNFLNKKQKKLYYFETTPTKQNQSLPNDNIFRFTRTLKNIQVNLIETLQKPPHREKTAICFDNEKLYLYGGIGCQPNLQLAQFDLNTEKWKFPIQLKYSKYRPTIPISGHSLMSYKGKGYVYGGSSTDLTHELSIINFADYSVTQGQKCLFRRKNHAVLMVSKYMIIHGGIESNQITNNMYFYDTQKDQWSYINKGLYDFPFLSHHAMASTFPSKTKKKTMNSLFEMVDPIFLYGGKDKNGNISDILYRIYIENQNIKIGAIQISNKISPQKRFCCCFHYVGNNTLLLYGGRNSESQQIDGQKQNSYNDIFTFNTQKLEWNRQNTSQILPSRYGMASTSYAGKVYVFGGFIENKYSDANIVVLSCWTPDLLKSKSNFNLGTRSVLANEKFI